MKKEHEETLAFITDKLSKYQNPRFGHALFNF